MMFRSRVWGSSITNEQSFSKLSPDVEAARKPKAVQEFLGKSGEIGELAVCFLQKWEDLGLIPSTHIKPWQW